jgi:hypothetical protein
MSLLFAPRLLRAKDEAGKLKKPGGTISDTGEITAEVPASEPSLAPVPDEATPAPEVVVETPKLSTLLSGIWLPSRSPVSVNVVVQEPEDSAVHTPPVEGTAPPPASDSPEAQPKTSHKQARAVAEQILLPDFLLVKKDGKTNLWDNFHLGRC